MMFGRHLGLWGAFAQKKLAFDAQQLGHVPTLVGPLALRERVVDRRKPLRHLPNTGQAFRQLSEKPRGTQDVAGLAEFVESGAQTPHPGGNITALDQ